MFNSTIMKVKTKKLGDKDDIIIYYGCTHTNRYREMIQPDAQSIDNNDLYYYNGTQNILVIK